MLFCDALSVKKPLPADRIVNDGPCACGDFEKCPVFLEVMDRLRQVEQQSAGRDEPSRKDPS
jgi:hypothetical protein